MGERTRYEPGTFCWTDLSTPDAAGAKAFYCRLLGWEAVDLPVEPEGTYTMLRLGGRDVCALSQRPADQGSPAWLSYVSVADVSDTADRARRAGATVVAEPFDVMDSGRMALLADPTGAIFAIWEARAHIGAGLVNDPGCLCLNQLDTTDAEAAARFYTEVFGWRSQSVGTEDQPYWSIYNGEGLNGGMMPLPPGAGAASHWLVYFATGDLDGSASLIGDLGGQVLVPPMAIGAGRIAVAMDPQGATFALFEGSVDP